MPKQLSLFGRDKQAVKILTSICTEKRREAISAIVQLVIAHIRTKAVKGGRNEE
jgi:hypothetical protein